MVEVDSGDFQIWKYWDIPQFENNDARMIKGDELAEQAWSLLLESVKLRLRSDVKTGVFLSGGLDSSLVTAAASQVSNVPVQTFTIGIPGSKLDETKYAKLIADSFSTKHTLLQIEKPSLDLISELTSFIDEPIADSSILPLFWLASSPVSMLKWHWEGMVEMNCLEAINTIKIYYEIQLI